MGAVNNNTWTTGINQEVWSPKRTLMRFTLLVEVSKKMHRKNNPHTTFSRLGDPYEQQRRRQWHPTPVLLPGKSHGWRSLVGCGPWRRWELDTTERLHFHFSLSCLGEGNGNPLQYSCRENPRVGGAWWAAIYGIAQSRTQLKRLSSSSSSSI